MLQLCLSRGSASFTTLGATGRVLENESSNTSNNEREPLQPPFGAQNLILAREIRTMQMRARPKMQAIINDCCKIICCKKQFKVILFIAVQTLHTRLLFEGSVMSPDVGKFDFGPNEHQMDPK